MQLPLFAVLTTDEDGYRRLHSVHESHGIALAVAQELDDEVSAVQADVIETSLYSETGKAVPNATTWEGLTAPELAATWGSDSAGDTGRQPGDGGILYQMSMHMDSDDANYWQQAANAVTRTIRNCVAYAGDTPQMVNQTKDLGGLCWLLDFICAKLPDDHIYNKLG